MASPISQQWIGFEKGQRVTVTLGGAERMGVFDHVGPMGNAWIRALAGSGRAASSGWWITDPSLVQPAPVSLAQARRQSALRDRRLQRSN